MSESNDFDLFVIGGGSGGVRAARVAANHGARVGICESYRYGGTCVIRGCVPKKMLVYASAYSEEFSDAAAYGWDLDAPSFDWARLIANKDKEIDRLNTIYMNLLDNAGVTLFHGSGRIVDPHTVAIDGQPVRAEKILIATGARPFKPRIPGIELSISSNEAFHLAHLPERVVVVGGGYIAVEFSCIFNGLGSSVDLIFRADQILRGFDEDMRHHLAGEMDKKGLRCHPHTLVQSIERHGHDLRVHLTDGSTIDADCVLYATGRKPNLEGIDPQRNAIATDENGAIIVDEWSRTSQANIFAVGDVTDRIALTPVALMEGHCFADTEFGQRPRKPDHRDVASAVFSQPELASVGLPEHEARAVYDDIVVYRSTFRTLKHSLTDNPEKSLVKLIVDRASDRVVGVHMIGPHAAEILQGVAIAVKCGATKAQFDATIGIHPTSAEEIVTLREPIGH